MPSINMLKLSWPGQPLPLPLWVVKRPATHHAVSEKAVCCLIQHTEKYFGILISQLENWCNQMGTEISGQMRSQNI